MEVICQNLGDFNLNIQGSQPTQLDILPKGNNSSNTAADKQSITIELLWELYPLIFIGYLTYLASRQNI